MNVPYNPQQNHWYRPIEERTPPLEPLKLLPYFEDVEAGLSVDVLVFGYFFDCANTPAFGIGYVNRLNQWHVVTTNGTYIIDGSNDDEFVILMWKYLPAEPCEVPPVPEAVKSIGQSTDFVPHHQDVKPPEFVTTPNTTGPEFTKGDWKAKLPSGEDITAHL